MVQNTGLAPFAKSEAMLNCWKQPEMDSGSSVSVCNKHNRWFDATAL